MLVFLVRLREDASIEKSVDVFPPMCALACIIDFYSAAATGRLALHQVSIETFIDYIYNLFTMASFGTLFYFCFRNLVVVVLSGAKPMK